MNFNTGSSYKKTERNSILIFTIKSKLFVLSRVIINSPDFSFSAKSYGKTNSYKLYFEKNEIWNFLVKKKKKKVKLGNIFSSLEVCGFFFNLIIVFFL